MSQNELYQWTAQIKQVFWELGVWQAIGLALYSYGGGRIAAQCAESSGGETECGRESGQRATALRRVVSQSTDRLARLLSGVERLGAALLDGNNPVFAGR